MKGQLNNPGQPHRKADLDRSHGSNEEGTRERLSDLFTAGILSGTQLAGETIPFKIIPSGGLTIDVGSGIAIAPHTVDLPPSVSSEEPLYGGTGNTTGGERILITSADAAVVYDRSAGGGAGSGTGTGPFEESTDGIGGFTPTPTSTGTTGMDLTALNGSLVKIWLAYLNTVDSATSSLHKVTASNVLYPKSEDGYELVADTATPGGDAKYILVGTVDLTGSPASVTAGLIDQTDSTTMTVARARNKRIGITISDAATPATFADGETKFVDDLVNCRGTGTGGRTPANPFDQSVFDLEGTGSLGTNAIQAQKDSHTNGIVDRAAGGAMAMAVNNAPPPSITASGIDSIVNVDQLSGDESVYIAGTRYTALEPDSVDLGGDAYIGFDAPGDISGVYSLFVKVVGADAVVDKKLVAVSIADDELKIGEVTWNGVDTLSALTPSFPFALTDSTDIRTDAVESRHITDADGTSGQITTAGEGIKTPHLQDLAVTNPKIADNAVTGAKVDETSSYTVTGLTATGLVDGAGFAGFMQWKKFTVAETAFTSATASESVALFTLDAGGFIHAMKIKHSASFTGGSISAFTLEVGITGTEGKYASAFDVFQGPGDTTFQGTTLFFSENHASTTPVLITARATGDTVDNATAGSVDVWALVSTAI